MPILRAGGDHACRPRRFAGRAANYLTYFASAAVAGARACRGPTSSWRSPIRRSSGWPRWLRRARGAGAVRLPLPGHLSGGGARSSRTSRASAVNARARARQPLLLVASADRGGRARRDDARRLVDGKGADPRSVAVIHNWADCAAIAPPARRTTRSRARTASPSSSSSCTRATSACRRISTCSSTRPRASRPHRDIVVVIVGDGAAAPALEAPRPRAGPRQRPLPALPAARAPARVVRHRRRVRRLAQARASPATSCRASSTASWPPGGRTSRRWSEPARSRRSRRRTTAGLLAAPGDADDLAAPDPRALRRPRRWARGMGANARRRRRSRFDRPVQVAAYARACSRGLAATRGRGRARRCAQARRSTSSLAGLGLLGLAAALGGSSPLAIKLEDGGPGLLRPGARGQGRPALPELEVPLDDPRRRPALRPAAGDARTTRASRASAACSGRRPWTSCRSSGTSSAAT